MHSIFLALLGIGLQMQQLWFWGMDPLEVRARINQRIMEVEAEEPEVHRVIDEDVHGTAVRVYFPNEEKKRPAVLLIHGGGWIAGSVDTHDYLARYLCREAQAVVISVDYSLAPESKFPTQLEECYEVFHWIHQQQRELQIDPTRIIVAGDSAGGNMTAALCLLARDRRGPQFSLQILINPSPDLTCEGTLEKQEDEGDYTRWFAAQYVRNVEDLNHPYVSPNIAPDLKGLPPAVVILAEYDEVFLDGQKYADRLQEAGVPTLVYTQYGIGHLAGHGARASKPARESLNVAVRAIRRP